MELFNITDPQPNKERHRLSLYTLLALDDDSMKALKITSVDVILKGIAQLRTGLGAGWRSDDPALPGANKERQPES